MSPGDTPPSIGRFQLLRVVRHDGATTLHEALDPEGGEKVALVTSPAGADAAEEDRLAFRLSRMRHPNVVSVLDAGRHGDVAFVAAECLHTEPLSAFVARAGCMPLFQGLPLLLQLLSAIEHAQARRLVHATIDLDHVQVTPGGQVKLPAQGWSLSTDRQPNLEAAARMGHVLLSGTCPPQLRRAFDEVLLRAQAPEPEARFARADDFILALLGAAGYLVASGTPALKPSVPAESHLAAPVVELAPDAVHAVARTARRQRRPHRGGRALLATCLVAALLVPRLVGDGLFSGGTQPQRSAGTAALGAPPAPLATPVAAAAAAAVAPAAVAPAAPAPAAPAPVAPPAQPLDEAAPEQAPVPVARTTVQQRPVPLRARPAARPSHVAKPLATRGPAQRPRTTPVLTAASGCPYELSIARDLCEARLCNRPELRRTPMCVRLLAEQRAALARLRGTPD